MGPASDRSHCRISERGLLYVGRRVIWSIMTAFEVIDQIKALPPEERAKVVGYIREMEVEQPVRTMDRETFERSTKHVFDRHAELMRKLSQ